MQRRETGRSTDKTKDQSSGSQVPKIDMLKGQSKRLEQKEKEKTAAPGSTHDNPIILGGPRPSNKDEIKELDEGIKKLDKVSNKLAHEVDKGALIDRAKNLGLSEAHTKNFLAADKMAREAKSHRDSGNISRITYAIPYPSLRVGKEEERRVKRSLKRTSMW